MHHASTHLLLAPPLWVTPLEFRRVLWSQIKLPSLGYRVAFFVCCCV